MKNGSWEPCPERQHMWLKDVMEVWLGCHFAMDQYKINPVVRDTTPKGGVVRWASLVSHVMGVAIPDVFQPGSLRWFGKTQGLVVKMLPVSGEP
ncbi:hypothetical protein TNCV_2560431 [Trichonephila clavipes]|uniref:Uncharacterized protein n=1 Tax=Trichonephila clavipes TaxID=2585209 RepID=A0A8X6UNM5_TRICX|nr:hypothetical protein TNCV_2560431 [Trichonephila clavipes]